MPRHPPRRIFSCGNAWKVRCLDEDLHHAMALFRRILDFANHVQFYSSDARYALDLRTCQDVF